MYRIWVNSIFVKIVYMHVLQALLIGLIIWSVGFAYL